MPCLGEIVLDRLRPHHIDELVDQIEAHNVTVRGARASSDPAGVRAGVRGVRLTGQATIARIRATLRKAFNDALAREIIVGVANPAWSRLPTRDRDR